MRCKRGSDAVGTNLRVRLTCTLLQDAFLELIKDRSFDSITVSQIVEKAGVNRATFYRHYQDKYQLVTAIFADAVNSLFLAARFPEPHFLDADEAPKEFLEKFLKTVMEYIGVNANLYRSLFSSSANVELERHIRDQIVPILKSRIEYLVARGKAVSWIGGVPQLPQSDIPYIFMANNVIGAIRWWLLEGQGKDLERVAEWILLFIRCGAGGLFSVK